MTSPRSPAWVPAPPLRSPEPRVPQSDTNDTHVGKAGGECASEAPATFATDQVIGAFGFWREQL